MRDPTRRNRNIGTKKSGHGQDNRMVVPTQWGPYGRLDRFDHIGEHRCEFIYVHGRALPVIVATPLDGWAHPCDKRDVGRVLGQLPRTDLSPVAGIVLAQPTRKADQLTPIWGSYRFWQTIPPHLDGPSIVLSAQPSPLRFRWPRRGLSPDRVREFKRLRAYSSEATESKRDVELTFTTGAVRRMMMEVTIPHEVGHVVHKERIVRTADKAGWERWKAIPTREKEEFADRYAREAGIRID